MSNTLPQDTRAPHRQQRWVELENVGQDAIPPFAVVEIVESRRPETNDTDPAGGPTVIQVRKPSIDSCPHIAFNGPTPIESGKRGRVGTFDCPAMVMYAGSTPTSGQMWGTVKDSFSIGRGRQGVVIIGDADADMQIVRVMRSERLLRVTPYADQSYLPPGGLLRCLVKRWNGSVWINTDSVVVVKDPFFRTCALYGEDFWCESYGFDPSTKLEEFQTVSEFGLRRRGIIAQSIIEPNTSGFVKIISSTLQSCTHDKEFPVIVACYRDSSGTTLKQGDEVFVHYHPEFRNWFILPIGSGSGVIRFEMLSKLPLGGQGTAVEVETGPGFKRKGEPFRIKDPWRDPGMFRYDPKSGYPDQFNVANPTKRGYMGICCIPPNPEMYGDQPIREIIWMEQIARHIVFKATEDKLNSQTVKVEIVGNDWYHLQGKNPLETDLYNDNDPNDKFILVYDVPGGFFFPHMLKGSYGYARYNDRDHWYEIINAQQMCMFVNASLGANLCPGDGTAVISGFDRFTFSPFNQLPETLTSASNPFLLSAKNADDVLLGWSESANDWQVIQARHRARTVVKNYELENSGCILQITGDNERFSLMGCEEEGADLTYITFDEVEVVTDFGTTDNVDGSIDTCKITANRVKVCALNQQASSSVDVASFSTVFVLQDVYQNGLCIDGIGTNLFVLCQEIPEVVPNLICGTDCASS